MKNSNIFSCLYITALSIGAFILYTGCSGSSGNRAARQDTIVSPAADVTPGAAAPGAELKPGSYPHILVENDTGKEKKVKYQFPFEGDTVRFELKVDRAVLEGARNANKYAVAVAGEEDPDWKDKYNRAFIDDPAQAPFLDKLHRELLKIAKKKSLDGDRTVELMTSFVQHIEYDTTKAGQPRFPIETFADKKGDCDDKSRLLVALLMRSNYGVATLHFDSENHMAVGIRSNGLEYRNTGYTYIETTTPSLIGFPFSDNADIQLHTVPTVHPVGNGTRKYTASKDVAFIADTLKAQEKKIQKEQETLASLNDDCTDAGKRVDTLGQQVSSNANNVDAYNKAVDQYNSLVKKQRKLANAINKRIGLRNYIVEHNADRYPTIRHIRKILKEIE